MMKVEFKIVTQRPNTSDTWQTTAPDMFIALGLLAQTLKCEIKTDGPVLFSGKYSAPGASLKITFNCVLSGEGGCEYRAVLYAVAKVQSAAEQLVRELRTTGHDLKAEQVTVPLTPEPTLVPDPEDTSKMRMAAAWGEG